MADDAARAERQARLSKALGAAYLSHQIEQLEDRVTSNLTLGGRGGRGGRGRRGGGGGGGGGRRGGGGNQRTQEAPLRKPTTAALAVTEDSHVETRLVLDTSALVFALPFVTRLLRSGRAELIVPLETLRTLDLLKKGMHPFAVAARTATRFVETEQRRTRAPGKEEGDVGDDGWRKLRPGLWIQRDHEQEHIGPASDRAESSDDPTTPPPFIQSTLACALYFRKFWDLTSSQPVLAVAVPPEGTRVPPEDPVARYAERADGRALREWADRGDVVVHLFGQRGDDSESDVEGDEVANADVRKLDAAGSPGAGENGFLDQEEGRVMTLTAPSDDPRARPSRRPQPAAPRAPPTTGDRVPKIFDAEKGMVPSTEVLAQRERERERELRNGRRGGGGRGKAPVPTTRPAPRENANNAPPAPVILRRVPVIPTDPPEPRERSQQWSRGRKEPRGARGGRGGKPLTAAEDQGPKVMLLQRPK